MLFGSESGAAYPSVGVPPPSWRARLRSSTRHPARRHGGRRAHPDDRVDPSSPTALVETLTQQNLERGHTLPADSRR